jgi:hypothetical protein
MRRLSDAQHDTLAEQRDWGTVKPGTRPERAANTRTRSTSTASGVTLLTLTARQCVEIGDSKAAKITLVKRGQG